MVARFFGLGLGFAGGRDASSVRVGVAMPLKRSPMRLARPMIALRVS